MTWATRPLFDRLVELHGPMDSGTRGALAAVVNAVLRAPRGALEEAERLDRIATVLNEAAIELRLAHAAAAIEL